MKIETDDDRLVLISAFRYALGRHSYIPSVVAGVLEQCWADLTGHDQRLIKREIAEAIERGHAGMNYDVATWRRVLALGENDDKRTVNLCAEPSALGRS